MNDNERAIPVPERLLAARKAAGLSLYDAAAKVHVSTGAVSQYENGISIPSWAILKMLSLCYETNVEYLCGMSDDSAPDQVLIDINLMNREQRLLTYYRTLSEQKKDLVDEMVERLSNMD